MVLPPPFFFSRVGKKRTPFKKQNIKKRKFKFPLQKKKPEKKIFLEKPTYVFFFEEKNQIKIFWLFFFFLPPEKKFPWFGKKLPPQQNLGFVSPQRGIEKKLFWGFINLEIRFHFKKQKINGLKLENP